MLFSGQPERNEQWHGFHLHLWPWKSERDRVGTLHLWSLKELKRVDGVFLEAETRHYEIKINWQEMFAIQIPVPARRAEGAGKWEYVDSEMRLLRHLSPSIVRHTFPKFMCLVYSRKLCLMWLWPSFMKRKKKHFLKRLLLETSVF